MMNDEWKSERPGKQGGRPDWSWSAAIHRSSFIVRRSPPGASPVPTDPDPAPKTPFDALVEPEPAEVAGPHPPAPGVEEYVAQIKETADKLIRDRVGRGDAKMLATALRELRYCFKVFAAYRGKRKVTVFGSARTRPE